MLSSEKFFRGSRSQGFYEIALLKISLNSKKKFCHGVLFGTQPTICHCSWFSVHTAKFSEQVSYRISLGKCICIYFFALQGLFIQLFLRLIMCLSNSSSLLPVNFKSDMGSFEIIWRKKLLNINML